MNRRGGNVTLSTLSTLLLFFRREYREGRQGRTYHALIGAFVYIATLHERRSSSGALLLFPALAHIVVSMQYKSQHALRTVVAKVMSLIHCSRLKTTHST